MASKGKKGKGGGNQAAAKAAEAESEHDEAPSSGGGDGHDHGEHVAETAHAKAMAKGDDRQPGHPHEHEGKGHKHEHKPNIREYIIIFFVLTLLTALEVGIAQPSLGISKNLMRLGLVGLALTKAAIVGLYYMHMKHETRVMKLTVVLPMAAPTIYAIVLITEAAWRLTRW